MYVSIRIVESIVSTTRNHIPISALFTGTRVISICNRHITPNDITIGSNIVINILCSNHSSTTNACRTTRIVSYRNHCLTPNFVSKRLRVRSSGVQPTRCTHVTTAHNAAATVTSDRRVTGITNLSNLRFVVRSNHHTPVSVGCVVPSYIPTLPSRRTNTIVATTSVRTFFTRRPNSIFNLNRVVDLPNIFVTSPRAYTHVSTTGRAPSGRISNRTPLITNGSLGTCTTTNVVTSRRSAVPRRTLSGLSHNVCIVLHRNAYDRSLTGLSPVLLRGPTHTHHYYFTASSHTPSSTLTANVVSGTYHITVRTNVSPIITVSVTSLSATRTFNLSRNYHSPRRLHNTVTPNGHTSLLILGSLAFTATPRQMCTTNTLITRSNAFINRVSPRVTRITTLTSRLHTSIGLPGLSLSIFSCTFGPNRTIVSIVPNVTVANVTHPRDTRNLHHVVLVRHRNHNISLRTRNTSNSNPTNLNLINGRVNHN